MEKDFKNHHTGTSKKSKSNHSGIAKPYFYRHYSQLLTLGYIPIGKAKLPLPRYFQRIAHKHYCHYYDTSAFFDTVNRKALYRPFKDQQPIKEIADLYIYFKTVKSEKQLDLEKEWDKTISHYLTTKTEPDFIKSNENSLYDF